MRDEYQKRNFESKSRLEILLIAQRIIPFMVELPMIHAEVVLGEYTEVSLVSMPQIQAAIPKKIEL